MSAMQRGRLTIPTDADYAEGTKKFIKEWGADAVRDCDGVSLPEDVKQFGCEVYKAYFIVREDHAYARILAERSAHVAAQGRNGRYAHDRSACRYLSGGIQGQYGTSERILAGD